MKRIFFLLLLIHCMKCALIALPVSNPAEASLFGEGVFQPIFRWDFPCNLRVGYMYDHVFNRYLRVDNHGPGNTVNRTTIATDAGLLTLNYKDRLEIFSTLGATRISFRTTPKSFGNVVLANGQQTPSLNAW